MGSGTNTRTLIGGPLNGQERAVYGSLKVPTGYDAGWKHACGHGAVDFGVYDHDGVWVAPEHGRVYDDVCPTCDEFGKVAF